jgi:TPR repeat protein
MLGNRDVLSMIRTAAMAAALISPAVAQAEGGTSQAAQECDALFNMEKIDWRRTVEACLGAAIESTSSARLTFQLGYALEAGKQYESAAKIYDRAATLGSVGALENLGALYANGQGVPKDIPHAMILFRKAADQGRVNSELNLGKMYDETKDFAQAAIWYRKAAEHGDTEAANNLGSLYYNGLGVPENNQEAIFWFKKAAAAGNAMAQKNLDRVAEDQRRARAASAPSNSEYERTKQDIDQSRRLRCGNYQMSGNRDGMSTIPGCY